MWYSRNLCAVLLLAIGVFSLPVFGQLAATSQTPLSAPVRDALLLTGGTIQSLTFSFDPVHETLYTAIDADGATYTLVLDRHSLRSDSFQLLVDVGGNQLVRYPEPRVCTYKGTVVEDSSLRARGSFYDGGLRAMVFGPTSTWSIQPLRDVLSGAPLDQHVVYRGDQVRPDGSVCGLDTSQIPAPTGGGAAPFGGTGIKVCELGLDADFEYYQDSSSSVSATVNDLENIINLVEAAYEVPGILIHYDVTVIIVRTASGTYTTSSPGGLLTQFENRWQLSPESTIQRDVAHLFTGRNLDGTTIGIANLSAICSSSFGYGLSESKYTSNINLRTSLTAHELGHNWSATHCDSAPGDCHIMCSSNGGCDGIPPVSFVGQSTTQIFNFRNSRTCLHDLPESAALPFTDNFPSTSINTGLWSYIDGPSSGTGGVAEPSAPNSLTLNATGSGLYSDDDIRSTFILLLGITAPTLQYSTQHRGVPAGGVLHVEYWRTSEEWVSLNVLTSDGIDESVYTTHTHLLPANARHNEFRLRFRVDVASASQNWYVDNVSLTNGSPPADEPPFLSVVSPSAGPLTGNSFVNVLGSFFTSDASVFFGGAPLVSPQYVNSTLITGLTPPAVVSGPVVVSISQASGSDFLSEGYLYAQSNLQLEGAQGFIGSITEAGIFASTDSPLEGYSIAVDFDGQHIDIVEVTVVGTGADGADFVAPNYSNNPTDSWWTIGVLMDLSPPIVDVVPAGIGQSIAVARYAVSPTAPVGTFVQTTLVNGIGVPPVDNIFSISGGTAVVPSFTQGLIQILAGGFVRGDANDDGIVDIADPVTTLNYLFAMGPASCLDALDSNDDGQLNVADPIFSLSYLFSQGTPPPAPFPGEGADPTADTLGCL
ncbi:MAG: M12 family metallo-peptidase [Planctomycetota bacterium]